MKLRFAFLFLFVTNCYCEKIALLGSHYVSNSPYKFYLITDEVNPSSTVNVNLNYDDGQNEPETFADFSVNPIEHDFSVRNSNKYELNVASKNCNQKANLIKTSDQSIIFIHLNKPIFKTGEEMKFKVFVLDQKMIPMSKHKQMDITVFDSMRNVVKNLNDAKGDEFGVFEDSLQIADNPYLGNWMIQVVIGDKNVTKNFEVQNYKLSDIEVLIDAPSVVAHADRYLYMNVYVKSSDENIVSGTAKISVTASFVNGKEIVINKSNFKTVDLKAFKTPIKLDFSEDLEIKFPTVDMILKIKIEVTGRSSIRSKTAQKEIKLMHKGRNTFQIVRKKYFKPTFKYPMKIRVKTADGNLDNSFNQLSMTIQYINDRPSDVKKYSINLKNGETTQYFEPTKDTKKIIVNLKFADVEKKEEIDVFPTFGVQEYMQIAVVGKNTTVGGKVRLSVKATENMEELHLIVFGIQGIVHSEKFADSVDKDVFEVSFKLTEDMKPEARGMVFYVKNGAIIYDEFSVSLGFTIENSLDITVDQDVKPNTNTIIGVKTEDESKVILTAIDSSSALLKRNYEISRTNIYNELSYYLNKKFPSAGRYHFEKINPYILEPLINCESGVSTRSSFSSDIEDEEVDNGVHQYFPTVAFDQVYNSESSDVENVEMQVPNSLSTWKFYGISIHKTRGFTVAKVQPEIAVKNPIWAQIEAPLQIRPNEILRVRVTAFNFQNNQQDVSIVIHIENGNFMDQKDHKTKKDCLDFNKNSEKSKTFTEQLPANGQPVTVNFLISTDKLQPIKIKVKVTADESTYESEKVIDVNGFHLMSKKFLSSYFIETQDNSRFEKTINFPTKELSNNQQPFMTLHGNLFGPALNGLEAIFNKSMTLPEERMLKFASSIIIHKFTKLKGFKNDAANIKAFNDMHKGYQEALPILQEILNNNKTNQIWFASFITGILIDSSEFISIDSKLIDKSLDFIKSQMKMAGNFEYNKDDDLHRDIGSGAARSTVQTALIANTFLKKKDDFKIEIDKMLKYIRENERRDESIYTKAVVAYTHALNQDEDEAKEVIAKIKTSYNKPKDMSAHVELLSYIILTKILIKEDPKAEVDLLISMHRNADGGFYSPYDTVLGLQALYEYTKDKELSTKNSNYAIGNKNGTLNAFDSVTFKVSKDDKMTLSADALAYASIYYHSNKVDILDIYITKSSMPSNADIINTNFEFTFNPKHNNPIETNQIVVEIELPRGHRYIEHDANAIINSFELQNNDTNAVFYLKNIERFKNYALTLRTSKVYDFYGTMTRAVWIYDYYRPNMRRYTGVVQDYNDVACNDVK